MSDLLNKILTEKKATVAEAYELFDSLEPVTDYEFMKGRWKGTEIYSGNPWDELLPNSGWYGKIFTSEEEVHPLVYNGEEGEIWPVDPANVPLGFQMPKGEYLQPLFAAARPVLQAKTSSARLRNIEYRGRVCTTMCYDATPVLDYFSKIDENRIFGLMDWKGIPVPYVFVLERDDHSGLRFDFEGNS